MVVNPCRSRVRKVELTFFLNRVPQRGPSTFSSPSPWRSDQPVREELFSAERLEEHARSLAIAQVVTPKPGKGYPLAGRLADNGAVLLAAYRAVAKAIDERRAITPAAEWLVDNYHLVERQIREIRSALPPGYHRQLPKLADGPFKGYPRVFGLAWAFVAHTDSHFDADLLCRFVSAYQEVQVLTIGELWAVAITLRIVLVENLRRIAERITHSSAARLEADGLADRLLGSGGRAAEPVLADGEWAGYVRAAAFGHTVGGAVGLAQVSCPDGVTGPWLAAREFRVRTGSGDVPARLQLAPFYDPQRTRILA